jgi:hypothetical protein
MRLRVIDYYAALAPIPFQRLMYSIVQNLKNVHFDAVTTPARKIMRQLSSYLLQDTYVAENLPHFWGIICIFCEF